MSRTAEFKIKVPGLRWEDTPVISTLITSSLLSGNLIHGHAKAIAKLVMREVRWNWQDSPQGHYVGSGYRLPVHLRANNEQEELEPAADLDAAEQWMWEHGGPTYQETPDPANDDCPF